MAGKGGGLNGAAVIGGLLIATVVGALSGYALARLDLASELYQRPPVAILDSARFQAVAGGAGAPERTAAAVREAARRLAAGGYVVLDSQAVLAAPEDLYVPMD